MPLLNRCETNMQQEGLIDNWKQDMPGWRYRTAALIEQAMTVPALTVGQVSSLTPRQRRANDARSKAACYRRRRDD